MNNDKFSNDIRDLRGRNRSLGLAVAGLVFALILALAIILKQLGSERTVVVPPSIDKSFWVTKDRVSKEYLEQMGAFVGWLILDVSPESIDWKKDILLSYVTADQSGAMKTRQDLEAERLKRMNASTFFAPKQLVPNEDTQSIVLVGRLRTQVNGQDTTTDTKSYLAEFAYLGGRVHLKTFKEIPNVQQTPAQALAVGSSATR
ncbi:type IV conjugative transfer system protein TraE [Herbaspirillum sp. ST 5-3]|uniref:type IV conjugative transfer system protein TraE n=1 Tax=Oxalobacteraceae TaxID=75682 RepID=UPI0010A32767|nr:type IV conjugative transfer system protein TraE [Herbaspirillum sp. ST 5-3]